jgi:hypothetical protein
MVLGAAFAALKIRRALPMKTIPQILLILLILAQTTAFAQAIWNGTADTAWYNKSKTEFTITMPEQLAGLMSLISAKNDFKGKTVKLGANIMLNDTANWKSWASKPPANEWVASGYPFKGIFDGNGFAVSGVYINQSKARDFEIVECFPLPCEKNTSGFLWFVYGLFGHVGSTGEIKNLGVVASYIEGKGNVAGFAGVNFGVISNSYSTAWVAGKDFVKRTDAARVGGIVGTNRGNIINSYSAGALTGKECVGGLAGKNTGAITNSYSISAVTGERNAGSLAGSYKDADCKDGLEERSYVYHGAASDSYYNKEKSGQRDAKGYGKTAMQMQSMEFVDSLNFIASLLSMNAWEHSAGKYPTLSGKIANAASVDKFFANGNGTKVAPYIISTKRHLENFAWLVNKGAHFYGKHVKLAAHIALNDTVNWQSWASKPPANKWIPIGIYNYPFKGIFDGNGFTVSGVYINSSESFQGLFGYAVLGEIKNVGVIASHVKGNDLVGGLVGALFNGSVSNSYSISIVHGNKKAGGLIGGVGILINIFIHIVSEINIAGGLVGVVDIVNNSYSIGKVSGNEGVGGLVGVNIGAWDNSYLCSKIANSYSTALVTGKNYVGGLVGMNDYSAMIANSYSVGAVTGLENTGGFIGINDGVSTIINSYYDKQTSGQSKGGNGEGKTTAEMKQKSTYKGWDFGTVWGISGEVNGGYPYLRK